MFITHTLSAIEDREANLRNRISSLDEQKMMEAVDDRFNEVESLLNKETVSDYMEAKETIDQM